MMKKIEASVYLDQSNGRPSIVICPAATPGECIIVGGNLGVVGFGDYVGPDLVAKELRRRVDEREARDLRERPIDDLELSVRSSNCLRNAGIRTVGDLLTRSRKDLLSLPHFGSYSLREVVDALDDMEIVF